MDYCSFLDQEKEGTESHLSYLSKEELFQKSFCTTKAIFKHKHTYKRKTANNNMCLKRKDSEDLIKQLKACRLNTEEKSLNEEDNVIENSPIWAKFQGLELNVDEKFEEEDINQLNEELEQEDMSTSLNVADMIRNINVSDS